MDVFIDVFILPLKSHLFHFQIWPPTSRVLYYDARGLGTNVKTVLLVQTCMSHEIVYHMRVSPL